MGYEEPGSRDQQLMRTFDRIAKYLYWLRIFAFVGVLLLFALLIQGDEIVRTVIAR